MDGTINPVGVISPAFLPRIIAQKTYLQIPQNRCELTCQGGGRLGILTYRFINLSKKENVVMAGSINKVILVGNLGRDPEVRATQDGSKIVNLSLATSERWKDRNSGEQREKTEWHRVVIFNENLGRIAEQYLRKGSTCYIEGQIQTRKWTDQQGVEKYTTEVVLQRYRGELTLLGGRGDSQMGGGSYAGGGSDNFGSTPADSGRPAGGGTTPPPMRDASDLDDDIPF
jgi:single-strand DNA-binding protein